MLRRIFISIFLLVTPALAYADDQPTPAIDPTIQTPSQSSDSSTAQSGSPASLLGPNTGTSSTGASSSLQPAGNNPLQSGSGDSTNLTAPSGNELQGTSSDGISVKNLLNSNADGAPLSPTQTGISDTPFIAVGAGLLVIAL